MIPQRRRRHSATEHNTNVLTYEFDERILSAIKYTFSCYKDGKPLTLTTQFVVQIPSLGVDMLRKAYQNGFAVLIYTASDEECYEVGIEPLKPEFRAGIDPQWWVHKTAGEIKAGPLADDAEINKASATLKGLETKRLKDEQKGAVARRQRGVEGKLEEGLRRQETGERMWDDDSEEGYGRRQCNRRRIA